MKYKKHIIKVIYFYNKYIKYLQIKNKKNMGKICSSLQNSIYYIWNPNGEPDHSIQLREIETPQEELEDFTEEDKVLLEKNNDCNEEKTVVVDSFADETSEDGDEDDDDDEECEYNKDSEICLNEIDKNSIYYDMNQLSLLEDLNEFLDTLVVKVIDNSVSDEIVTKFIRECIKQGKTSLSVVDIFSALYQGVEDIPQQKEILIMVSFENRGRSIKRLYTTLSKDIINFVPKEEIVEKIVMVVANGSNERHMEPEYFSCLKYDDQEHHPFYILLQSFANIYVRKPDETIIYTTDSVTGRLCTHHVENNDTL